VAATNSANGWILRVAQIGEPDGDGGTFTAEHNGKVKTWHESSDQISTAAESLGRQGGESKSDAKAAAARENGKLGGRPPNN